MNEEEKFEAIVKSETDPYQRCFIDGLVKHNTKPLAPVSERVAERAIARLWRRS